MVSGHPPHSQYWFKGKSTERPYGWEWKPGFLQTFPEPDPLAHVWYQLFLRHNCVTCHIFLPKLFEIGRSSLTVNPTVFGSRTGLHCKKLTPCSGKPDIQGTGVDHTWISGLRRPDFEGINIHDFDVTIRVCFDGLLSDRNCYESHGPSCWPFSDIRTTLFDHMTYFILHPQ